METLKPSKKIAILSSVVIVVIATFAAATLAGCFKAHAASCEPSTNAPYSGSSVQLATNYYEFSEANLYQAQQTGRTVLYFWAPWCSTCSALDIELLEGKTSIPNGITLLRVPYDQASDLKQKYNVTVQHTFVQVDTEGELITAWVGGDIVDFSRYIK